MSPVTMSPRLLFLLFLVGCAPPATFPTALEPPRAERFLGFTASSRAYLVARSTPGDTLIEARRLPSRKLLFSVTVPLGAAAGAEALVEAPQLLEALRHRRLSLAPSASPSLPWEVILRRRGAASSLVVAAPPARAALAVRDLGAWPLLPALSPLHASPDGRWVALTIAFPGPHGASQVHLLRVDRTTVALHHHIALMAHRRGRYAEALRHWRKVLDRNPRDGLALYNSACALARLDRRDEALQRLSEAIIVAPRRFAPLVEHDPDLASLRDSPALRRWILQGRELDL